ncbi:MAG TPA: energy-coupling factor transporter transmembrane component T [Sphaerochaeta sp.]|nr:energy-coupling factor transporter transmembrane component T [Sphaerochaeta sp.]
MAEGLIFHYREQKAFLNRCNPLTKLLSILILLIPLAKASLPVTLALLTPLIVLTVTQRLPLYRYGKELRFFFVMIILIGITEYLATRLALHSITACLRFLAIILAGMLLADSTAPDDLARSLGSVLDKIPFVNGWAVASSIELTLSMVPLIFDVTDQVTTARKARMEKNRHPIKNISSVSASIFSLLLDRSEELTCALEARAFDPSRKRKTLPYTKDDLWLGVAVTLIMVFLYFSGIPVLVWA